MLYEGLIEVGSPRIFAGSGLEPRHHPAEWGTPSVIETSNRKCKSDSKIVRYIFLNRQFHLLEPHVSS
jgi:hypothetical protein